MTGLAARLAVPVVMLVFVVGYWLSIRDLALFARGFPMLIIGLLGVTVVLVIIVELRDWKAARTAPEVSEPARSGGAGSSAVPGRRSAGGLLRWASEGWGRTVTMLVLALLLARGIQTVGFYTSILAFLVVSLIILGVRSVVKLAAILVGSGVMIYVLFELLLQLRLPGPTPLP